MEVHHQELHAMTFARILPKGKKLWNVYVGCPFIEWLCFIIYSQRPFPPPTLWCLESWSNITMSMWHEGCTDGGW
jgi:hypothetical protein